eukprot:scaffold115687_cov75-Phaeocystis_antarctica.AAC.1
MVRMREGAQHGGRDLLLGRGGQVAEANFPNSPGTREVRNARRYETAKPHQDSQGRARTSAARGEGMPRGCTIAHWRHRATRAHGVVQSRCQEGK